MLNLSATDPCKTATDMLCIPVCEDGDIHDYPEISRLVEIAKAMKEFNGKQDESMLLYNLPETKAKRTVFVGLGKIEDLKTETIRAAVGKVTQQARELKTDSLAITVPSGERMKTASETVLKALCEGAFLANHVFDKYKGDKKKAPLKKISFIVKKENMAKWRPLLKSVVTVCSGTIMARDWISTPSNDKRPTAFAGEIAALAQKAKLKTTVMTEKALARKKFGSLLSVSAGSSNEARLVILEYSHPRATEKVAFVGKGVTFDSGGLNLKSADGMEDMKCDMSGAAAVAATMLTIAELRPAINVVAAIPLVENMPSGEATRPGDIVRSYSGKTIEILNTDAEGRLILADAIAYTIQRFRPSLLIDLATLTGACVIALGEKIAAVFATDDDLSQAILQAGENTYERCWRMPLPEDYRSLIKSDFADLRNLATSRWGGAISAALFLSEFVGKTPWAHLDIAGPAFAKKAGAYCDVGGSGFGVRLLCDFIETRTGR